MKCEGFSELFTKSKSHQSSSRQSTQQTPERQRDNANFSTEGLPFSYSVTSQGLVSRRLVLLLEHSGCASTTYLSNTYITTYIICKAESMSI